MCEAKKTILAARGVCVNSDYGMAVGAFEPFSTAAAAEPSDREWEAIHTWQHHVEGGCEALLSLRFAVFSRLSSADVVEAAALSANDLRQRHLAPGQGLLRARVSVTRSKTGASKKFIVGAGGIDVFASSVRVDLLAPPSMRSDGNATYPLRPNGLGALEEAWFAVFGEDCSSIRTRGLVHTYCALGVPTPVPPSATRYTVLGGGTATLATGGYSYVAPNSGPVQGFQTIELDQNSVVAWEVEP